MADETVIDAEEAEVSRLRQLAESAYLEARATVFDVTDPPFSVTALDPGQRATLIRLEAAQQALRDFQAARRGRRGRADQEEGV